ncbi:hypothetical protein CCAX7_25500 [Capsulimonas corticalis]|uniref:Uncharacterized protein n=1 Tax=Capsulimonas corticalis TaxID=2219043 RepID=A0A402CVQ9_9BACT|nr:AraC family transcriptional regulator [Capsulimonas corticalis]BDI30499.1 hypothetical protein CCAX7_25500 [Capsulimonas corticalis]
MMIDERVHITLRQIKTAHYESLCIEDQTLPFWVISHVRQGCVETRTGGERRTAPAGTVMIHPPHVSFCEIAEGPGMHEFLFLDAAMGEGVDLLRRRPVALTVPLTDPRAWSETFARLQQAERARSLAAVGYAVLLLSAIIDDWRAAGAPPRPASLAMPADRFADLVQYMREHLSERIDRDALASRMSLQPGSFNRAFRRAYGVSPMRMLRSLRLAHARRLVETTDDTMESISLRCGFEDVSYFSRAFRSCYGLPPGRYRQEMGEGPKSAWEGYSRSLCAPEPPDTIGV